MNSKMRLVIVKKKDKAYESTLTVCKIGKKKLEQKRRNKPKNQQLGLLGISTKYQPWENDKNPLINILTFLESVPITGRKFPTQISFIHDQLSTIVSPKDF